MKCPWWPRLSAARSVQPQWKRILSSKQIVDDLIVASEVYRGRSHLAAHNPESRSSTSPTVFPSESRMNDCHSSCPIGPSVFVVCVKIRCAVEMTSTSPTRAIADSRSSTRR